MANLVADISLGRTVEYHQRVENSDPTNAVLTLVVLASGHESDATLRTYATLAALLAPAANAEPGNVGYGRIELDQGDIATASVDTATHRTTITFPNQTYVTVAAGDSWSKLVACYDSDSTGGTDANIVPMAFFDLRISNAAIVPNGNDIIIAAPNGYIVAS